MRKIPTTASVRSPTGLVALAQPDETATVMAATPVLTQAPHAACTPTAMAVPETGSGTTGAVLGAMLGERLEGQGGSVTHTVRECTEQWIQVSAYQFEHELNGRRYTTQMNLAPGQTLMIQAAPPVDRAPSRSSWLEGVTPVKTLIFDGPLLK